MDWLVSILESVFQWSFSFLKLVPELPWKFFTLVISGGLIYWLFCQKKYNAQAEADENQIK